MTSQRKQRNIYILSDFVSTSLAIFLFNIFRASYIFPDHGSIARFYAMPWVGAGQVLFPLACLVIFTLSGYYNDVLRKSRLQDFITTIGGCIAATLLFTFTALIDDLSADRTRDYLIFCVLLFILFACVMPPRLIHTNIIARRLRNGKIRFNTVVIGHMLHPDRVAEYLSTVTPGSGMHAVAILADGADDDKSCTSPLLPLPFEPLGRLESVCRERDVRQIVLLPHPEGDWDASLKVLNKLMLLDIPVFMPRKGVRIPGWRSRHMDVTAEPMVNLSGADISASAANMKRLADICVSAVAMTVLAVPMALGCLVLWLSTGQNPVYSQERLGRHRKKFKIYKLRTMVSDAEPDGTPRLSSSDDTRITPPGRFMRKYRLDELPQFWNVLRGDMSIVGPRPEREYFARKITEREPSYTLLYQVRPGITSWGMVKYGYASDIDQMIDRMRYDLLYVENLSFLLDMKILFYTFHTVLTGKGI